MAGEPMSYWDYVKAAFWKPVRSRILGAMPLTQMLLVSFGLAGFFNPGFWLLGLAATVAFVGGRSASERFQKLVEAERLAARAGSAEDRMKAAYERLEPASQARYRALVVVVPRDPRPRRGGGRERPHRLPRRQPQPAALALPAPPRVARGDHGHPRAGGPPAARDGPREPQGAARRGRRPRGRARAVAQGHPRDPGEAPRQPRHRHEQPGGGRRRARADRAAGAPRARGERGLPLAGGPLRPARRRLPDPRRDLALPRPARGDLLRPVRDRLRDGLGAPAAARAGGARPRSGAPPARRARGSARGSDDPDPDGIGPTDPAGGSMSEPSKAVGLPSWAEEMRQVFRAGATSQFVLHGNVFDLVPAPDGKGGTDFVSLSDFLTGTMFQPFDVVVRYDRGRGVRIEPPDPTRPDAYKGVEEVLRFLKGVDAFRGAPAAFDVVADKLEKLDLRDQLPRDPKRALEIVDRVLAFARRRAKVQDGKVVASPLKVAVDPRLRALHRPPGRPHLRRRPQPDPHPDPGLGRQPRRHELLRGDGADHREPRRPQPQPGRDARTARRSASRCPGPRTSTPTSSTSCPTRRSSTRPRR